MRKNKRRFDPRYFMDEKTDKKVLEEAMPRFTQLPDEPDLFQYGNEQKMDQTSTELEKRFMDGMLVSLQVPGFDGAYELLDTFITKMGNYVVTAEENPRPGDISKEQAEKIIDEIVNNLTVDRADLSYWSDPRDYDDDPDYTLQEMPKPGAASYSDIGRHSSRSLGAADSDLNEKFNTVVEALGQIGTIANTAAAAVQTEND